jgi:hypothetical protein
MNNADAVLLFDGIRRIVQKMIYQSISGWMFWNKVGGMAEAFQVVVTMMIIMLFGVFIRRALL